uniref:AMP-binding protein n=1 Tax=uncultured Campylobacter sp. TaxID=218934 RepID=UPI00260D9761
MKIELASSYGFCFGVKRAIKIAENAGDAATIGPLIHNNEEINRLEKNYNVKTLEGIDELKDEKNIGILLPSSSIAAIVNMALLAMGKVSVNLNYTLNETSLNHALRKANINTVITSSKFLEKLALKGFDLKDAMSGKAKFAEDISASVSKKDKFLALLTAFFAPVWLIKLCYFKRVNLEDTATILFSSGSEGEPKGIELSHKTLL